MSYGNSAHLTLYDKVWRDHVVHQHQDESCIIYIDRHLVHEVTSPQAFEGMRINNRAIARPDAILAVPDHNVPTVDRDKGILGITDELSRIQVETLGNNCKDFDLNFFNITDKRQGIVHIIGPEQGFTLPGTTIVCGDSHTSTHGAFGALAMGIGTSEVEHVLATQTLVLQKSKNMLVEVNGILPLGVTSKDVILYIIGITGAAGGVGCIVEYAGDTIRNLSMEGRMTICNMAVEGGARSGIIAPDEKTFEFLKGRPMAPSGAMWDQAVDFWSTLKTDTNATFDRHYSVNAADISPLVTWGTSPEDIVTINGSVPYPESFNTPEKRLSAKRSLEYMGLQPGTMMSDIPVDVVFIGSCTNSRIEDLRDAAMVVAGNRVADNVTAIVVPGSGLVKQQAEQEGLDKVFIDAGLQWRDAGCSMCLGMNSDQLGMHKRCASTSNRNFEGRQGRGGRTHLVSPAVAAATAIVGKLADSRTFTRS